MGNAKNLAFWAVVILLLVALFSVFQEGGGPRQGASIPYSDFLERVENGQVSSIVMDGERISGRLASGAEFQTIQPG
ncbi:MAG: ATP-dependent metallopeptidase FtsH/Yme1/Tma family protein, partial [Pseudomonadota bacterium]